MAADIVERVLPAQTEDRVYSSAIPQLVVNLSSAPAGIYSLKDLEALARRRLPRRIFGFVGRPF
jgi:hypothetical protein